MDHMQLASKVYFMPKNQRGDGDWRGKPVTSGTLAGHYKQGKVYRPPLLAFEGTQRNDWVLDDLPDLIWPVLLVHLFGDAAVVQAFFRAQEILIALLQERGDLPDGLDLDGRLTSLDQVPAELREAFLRSLREAGLAEVLFPSEVQAVLACYESAPGRWAFFPQGLPASAAEPEVDAAALLRMAVVNVVANRSLNAAVKSIGFGWGCVTGKLQVGPLADLWPSYVEWDEDRRSMADAAILSSFLAGKAMLTHRSPELLARMEAWADDFWDHNWSTLACRAAEPPVPLEEPEEDAHQQPHGTGDTPEAHDDERAHLEHLAAESCAQLDRHFRQFVDVALSPSHVRLRLRRRAKHEVLTGLVTWTYRALRGHLLTPEQWTSEHGANVLRSLCEARISMRWMIEHEGDGAFEAYQDYGNGKSKLLHHQREALAQEMGDDVPDLLAAAVREGRERWGSWAGEFQEVNLDTFSGLTLYRMAEEVGLEDDYRFVYQSASGVAHAEWWAVEDYAMQPCHEPLHLFHKLPVATRQVAIADQYPAMLIAWWADLAGIALDALAHAESRDEAV